MPILGGLLVSGCVPGPVSSSPAVSGAVTDARTGRPIPGAAVTISVYPRLPLRDGIAPSEPGTVTGDDGRFALARRYSLGLIGYLGDPPTYFAQVHVAKEGYRGYVTTQQCNGGDGGPSAPVRVDARLVPGHGPDIVQEPSSARPFTL